MTSYLVSGGSWSGDTIQAPSALTIYPSGTVFNKTLTMTRGSNAYHIQNQTQAGFTVWLTPYDVGDPMGGSGISMSSFTNNSSGASFNLGLQVTGSLAENLILGATINYDGNQTQAPASGILWSGTHVATVQLNGSLGYSDCYLQVVYDIDPAAFNGTVTNGSGWLFRLEDRTYTASDYEFRWWDNETDATNNTVGNCISTSNGVTWWSYSVADNSDTLEVWMRMRNVTAGGSWSQVYTSGVNETRLV
jgi:hypothetical protein